MDIDRNTVGGEDLRQGLLSSNLFHQSDAAFIIQDMVKERYLEEVTFDTYRKKKRWSREGNEEEDNTNRVFMASMPLFFRTIIMFGRM